MPWVPRGGIRVFVRTTRETPQQKTARFVEVRKEFLAVMRSERQARQAKARMEGVRLKGRRVQPIVNPDDPRHGTVAGYNAHQRWRMNEDPEHEACEKCRGAKREKARERYNSIEKRPGCLDCGKKIGKTSVRCPECNAKLRALPMTA